MTTATARFRDVITNEEALRAIVGRPSSGALAKGIDHIDEHFAGFIAKSPFVLIGSSDAAGNHDISPKGDPPGFVQVLDERTLVIPDRPGNRRADTFTNVIQNPNVALYFLVPGVRETLRVQGKASIVRDEELRERMAVAGKVPQLALVVEVEDAFMHCAKCMVRSKLWVSEAWPDSHDVPNLGAALVDQLQLEISKEAITESLEKDIRERLY
jgi:hypothetical protein